MRRKRKLGVRGLPETKKTKLKSLLSAAGKAAGRETLIRLCLPKKSRRISFDYGKKRIWTGTVLFAPKLVWMDGDGKTCHAFDSRPEGFGGTRREILSICVEDIKWFEEV